MNNKFKNIFKGYKNILIAISEEQKNRVFEPSRSSNGVFSQAKEAQTQTGEKSFAQGHKCYSEWQSQD